jgi:cadmium resistance protein CadD (predicted permease)
MRKWFLFLIVVILVYVFSKATQKKKTSSPFHQRFNETLSIVVWALVIAYVMSFLYWLYTQIFK